MEIKELAAYLDSYLRVREIDDSCVNGLEVEACGIIRRVALAVDARLGMFRKAKDAGANLIIVHHGMIWRKAPITGYMYERTKFLIENGIALYAAHLPLDMHPEVGNNVELGRLVGLTDTQPFALYRGSLVGLIGRPGGDQGDGLAFERLLDSVEAGLGVRPRAFRFGPEQVKRLAVCSGRASDSLEEAIDKGADTYLTGEVSHEALGVAEDAGVNLVFGGHYATETLGVKALGKRIAERFGVETVFIDYPTGL